MIILRAVADTCMVTPLVLPFGSMILSYSGQIDNVCILYSYCIALLTILLLIITHLINQIITKPQSYDPKICFDSERKDVMCFLSHPEMTMRGITESQFCDTAGAPAFSGRVSDLLWIFLRRREIGSEST